MERSYIHAYRGSDPRYEYMRLPCVNMALFTGGKQLFSARYRNSKGPMCGDPNLAIAGPGCNHDTSPPIDYTGMYDSEYCHFAMERVKYSTSKARCTAAGKTLADLWQEKLYPDFKLRWFSSYRACSSDPTDSCNKDSHCPTPGDTCVDYHMKPGCATYMHYGWVDNDCTLKVQVDGSGMVNVIHDPAFDHDIMLNNKNKFGVRWDQGAFPTVPPAGTVASSVNATLRCPSTSCVVHSDTCVCDFTVTTEPVIGATNPTAADLQDLDENALPIGALDPAAFDEGAYTMTTVGGVKMHTAATGDPMDTIFEMTVNGTTKYYANKVSTVTILGCAIEYVDGPVTGDVVPSSCDDSWSGSLLKAQARCNSDANCTALYWNGNYDDGQDWRVCSSVTANVNGTSKSKIKVPCEGVCVSPSRLAQTEHGST